MCLLMPVLSANYTGHLNLNDLNACVLLALFVLMTFNVTEVLKYSAILKNKILTKLGNNLSLHVLRTLILNVVIKQQVINWHAFCFNRITMQMEA